MTGQMRTQMVVPMPEVLLLARPEILALNPYKSARNLTPKGAVEQNKKIFLDANESPLSPVETPFLNRYPEPQPRQLLERFSDFYGLPASMIMIGRGSDEAIDLLVRVFCRPGLDRILICPPTYGMYEVSAKIQGAYVARIPLILDSNQISINAEEIKKLFLQENQAQPIKIIFLCSPNNPTGTAFDPNVLKDICEASQNRCIVVIDEAYAEFSDCISMTSQLSKFPNLVVLRTLSKAWALAGARCGVALAQSPVIQLLQKIRAPYPLSFPSVQTVLEATDKIHEKLLQERIELSRVERERLRTALLNIPTVYAIYPSAANFLLVKFRESEKILNSLRGRGIILRDRSRELGLDGCIRITIGTPEENTLLLSAIREVAIV
jgi:histidinol-phosphate aminotransferase